MVHICNFLAFGARNISDRVTPNNHSPYIHNMIIMLPIDGSAPDSNTHIRRVGPISTATEAICAYWLFWQADERKTIVWNETSYGGLKTLLSVLHLSIDSMWDNTAYSRWIRPSRLRSNKHNGAAWVREKAILHKVMRREAHKYIRYDVKEKKKKSNVHNTDDTFHIKYDYYANINHLRKSWINSK